MIETIVFYRVREAYGEFSNFHPDYPFTVEGEIYKTSEHYYQSKKAVKEEDRLAIINAPSAKDAANIGRDTSILIKPNWEDIKTTVMRLAIGLKFGNYPNLQDLLLSTGNAIIAEYSPYDSFWGTGPDGDGLNMLGKILMEYRDFLNSGKAFELGG